MLNAEHSPMNLLFISHLYPSSVEPGKAPFHRQLVAALAQRANVEVIAPVFRRTGRKLPPEEEIIDGVTVRHPRIWYTPGFLVHQHWRMYRSSIRHDRRLSAFIGGFNPDHVLIGYLYPDGVALGALCKELGIPYSIRVAGSDFRVRYDQPKLREIVLRTLQDAPLIFAHGHALNRDIGAALANASETNNECNRRLTPINADILDSHEKAQEAQEAAKIVAVYNGVDRKIFFRRYRKEAREMLNVGDGKMVLFVGNLVDVKAPDRLLHAWQILQQSGNESMTSNRTTPILPYSHTPRLLLVGSGPLMKKLQRLAEKLGIADHVQFLGQLPQDQVALWMNAADCLVLPSKSEGTPNVVLEALACGTPVVATPVGEAPELVKNDVNGYVVEQDVEKDDRRTQGPQDHGTTGPQDQLTPSQQKIAKTAKDADDLVQHLAEAIDKVLDRDWDRETIAAAVADFTWDRTGETILEKVSGVRCQVSGVPPEADRGSKVSGVSGRRVNGLEKTLERKLPEKERRWQVAEESEVYSVGGETCSRGWPIILTPDT